MSDVLNFQSTLPDNSLEFTGTVNQTGATGATGSSGVLTPATFSTNGSVKQTVYNVRDYGTIAADGTTDDSTVINLAMVAAESAGGGIVQLPAGTIGWNSRLSPRTNVKLRGMGMEATTLKNLSSHTGDWMILKTTNGISRFTLEDMTIDLNSSTSASGVQLRGATDCVINRVRFKNGASGGWFLLLGAATSATDGVINLDNKIIDCEFDTHAGTLEALLLYNAKNTQVIRPKFNAISSPAVGLWQKCYDTKIDKPVFRNCTGVGIYYSVTVENTEIYAPYFDNGGTISGANTSDNGNFGLTQAQGLAIIDPKFKGGSNTTTSTAIQLGSVNNVTVTNPVIELYQIGINFNTGNNSNTAAATNWTIINPQIINGNQPNNNWIIHPAIYFSAIGGSMYGKIIGGNIYDNLSGTQAYPIVFDGAFTWSDIDILYNRLSKSGGGTSIALNNSAALGANVVISGNRDYTGSSPAQTALSGVVDLTTIQNIGASKQINVDNTYFGVDTTTFPRMGLVKKSALDPMIGIGSATHFLVAKSSTTQTDPSSTYTTLFDLDNSGTATLTSVKTSGAGSQFASASYADPDSGQTYDAKFGGSNKGIAVRGVSLFNGDVTHADAKNIILGTTTGTKIGTATTQKLGFYNATPVVQPSSTSADATDLATAITLVNNLKAKLISLGLIA